MAKRLILFDFDGVITDSFRICFETNRQMCPHYTEESYRAMFEGNIVEAKRAVRHTPECRRDFDFFGAYAPRMLREAVAYPGVPEALKALSAGYDFVVVSSTVTSPVRELLEKFGLAGYFREILGRDVNDSKVEKIKMALAEFGVSPTDGVFVTDTLGDIREAAAAGVGSVAVSWGFHGRERLEKGNPFRIIDRPDELPAAVDGYFAR